MAPAPLLQGFAPANAPARERVGIPLLLLALWLAFEFGRPPNPLNIPLLISGALFIAWLTKADKQWNAQSPWWFILLAVMVIDIPLAINNYDAFWTTREVAVLFLCVCLPLQAFVTSVKKVRIWIYTFLLVAAYVGS